MVSFITSQREVTNLVIPAHAEIHALNESNDVDTFLRGDDSKGLQFTVVPFAPTNPSLPPIREDAFFDRVTCERTRVRPVSAPCPL